MLLRLQPEELRGVAFQGGGLGGIPKLGVPERAHRLRMAEANRVVAPEQQPVGPDDVAEKAE